MTFMVTRKSDPKLRPFLVWERSRSGVPVNIGTVLAQDKLSADIKATRLFKKTVWTTEKNVAAV